MATDISLTIKKLKEIIDRNGRGYLSDEPFMVYTELMTSGTSDRKTSGAILHFLVSGLASEIDEDINFDEFLHKIQKACSLNKKMSNELASIFLPLYSSENIEEWNGMDLQGLKQFKSQEFVCEWEGFATWVGGSVSIDCTYDAKIVLMPMESLVVDDDLAGKLKKNPFLTTNDICSHYAKLLGKHLDSKFDWYCTCDEYYEPVVGDFEIDDYVKEWCDKNGFKAISCEGSGDDSGYIPMDVRRYIRG